MFGLGFTEILLILVVALLVLGPKKLPEASRNLGRAFGELRRGADEFRREVNILDEPVQPSGKLSTESNPQTDQAQASADSQSDDDDESTETTSDDAGEKNEQS